MDAERQRADYASTTTPGSSGGLIVAVDTGSPAWRAGLRAGDVLASADGEPLRDIIDWQWLSDGDTVHVMALQAGESRELTVTREPGETWGIDFAELVFDRMRICRNDCAFCFMTQLPKGLRRALYVRDDDYRLSFLQGNFVTLTNLTDDDVDRVIAQHLSPLYVSLHAVDAAVRARLVCAREDRALERIDTLLEAGIDVHVQIVLVPGVNDAAVLDESLTWLAEREGVLSVGIVPLGFTGHQSVFDVSYNDAGAASAVISQIGPWQQAFRERDGVSWVHLADEFYLNAGERLPEAQEYDGFPQYENGIGIARSFFDDIAAARDSLTRSIEVLPKGVRVTLLTGMLAGPVITRALAPCDPARRVRVLPVANIFFGGNVSVAGLLAASDIAAAIDADGASGIYLLPDIVFNADGLTLDDVGLDELRAQAGADIRLVSSDAAGLLEGISEVVAEPASRTEKE